MDGSFEEDERICALKRELKERKTFRQRMFRIHWIHMRYFVDVVEIMGPAICALLRSAYFALWIGTQTCACESEATPCAHFRWGRYACIRPICPAHYDRLSVSVWQVKENTDTRISLHENEAEECSSSILECHLLLPARLKSHVNYNYFTLRHIYVYR